jgi:hypothetical protein
MGSRCVLHCTRRIARRMYLYTTRWWAANEKKIVACMEARYLLLAMDEPILSATDQMKVILPVKHHNNKRANRVIDLILALDRSFMYANCNRSQAS